MTEQRATIPTSRFALIVARRAMVVAAASLVVAALAVVVALWGGPETDPAEGAVPEQVQEDAAAARADAAAAAAIADAAAALAEQATSRAAAAEEALAAVLAEAGGAVDPEVIARLEAQLEEARTLAATALVAADTAATVEEAPTADAASEPADAAAVEDASESEEAAAVEDASESEEAAAVEDASESEEAAAVEDASESEEAAAVEDAPAPEPEDTDTAVSLPGEPYEFGPSAGAGLAVVGVAHDSALNVRAVPNGEVIARLDNVMDGVRDPAVYVREPDSDDIIVTVDLQRGIVATGNTRKLPTTIWHELRVGDLVGWASVNYLAPVGAGRDATAEVVEALGGTPTADTLSDLGLQVSALFASTGEVQSRTTISSRPGVFEAVGDITLDVLGLPDDAVRGYRINITADAGAEDWTQDDAGPFTLRSVTVTPICDSHRGVSDDGLCV